VADQVKAGRPRERAPERRQTLAPETLADVPGAALHRPEAQRLERRDGEAAALGSGKAPGEKVELRLLFRAPRDLRSAEVAEEGQVGIARAPA
jgi:hypothetical protein